MDKPSFSSSSSSPSFSIYNVEAKSLGKNGRVIHLVRVGRDRSLCGIVPGKNSFGWLPKGNSYLLGKMSCPQCIRKFTALTTKAMFGV